MDLNFDIRELVKSLSGITGQNGNELADMLKVFENVNLNQSELDEETTENNGPSNKRHQGIGEDEEENTQYLDNINQKEEDYDVMRNQNNQDDFIVSEEDNLNSQENEVKDKKNQNASVDRKDEKEPTEEEKEAWIDQVLNLDTNDTHPGEDMIFDEGELAKKNEKEIKDQNEREEKQAENERLYEIMTRDKHTKVQMIFLSDDEDEKKEEDHPEISSEDKYNGEEDIRKKQDQKGQENTKETKVIRESKEEQLKSKQDEQQFLNEMKQMYEQEGDYYDVKRYEQDHTELKKVSFMKDILPLVGQLTKQMNESQLKQQLSNPRKVEETEIEQLFKDQQQEEDELEDLFRDLSIK